MLTHSCVATRRLRGTAVGYGSGGLPLHQLQQALSTWTSCLVLWSVVGRSAEQRICWTRVSHSGSVQVLDCLVLLI